jgi:hypothetical protein
LPGNNLFSFNKKTDFGFEPMEAFARRILPAVYSGFEILLSSVFLHLRKDRAKLIFLSTRHSNQKDSS